MKALSLRLVASTTVLVVAPLQNVAASPPPPPPNYVMDVGKLLTGTESASTARQLASYVADDVRVYFNSKLVVAGKTDWMRAQARAKISSARVIGLSEGWEDGGTLLVVDEYDRVDRSSLPVGSVADPRLITRATLYRFGRDGKIHVIQTLLGGGFWMKP